LQVVSTPHPSGVTIPKPVTTTRLISILVHPSDRDTAAWPGALRRQEPEIVPHSAKEFCGRCIVQAARFGTRYLTARLGRRPLLSRQDLSASAFGVLFEELHGVADRQNGLGRIVWNLATEFLFEGHDEFDRVETVSAEVVDETRALGDLVGLNAQVLHDDL